jgi:hypothetical protein
MQLNQSILTPPLRMLSPPLLPPLLLPLKFLPLPLPIPFRRTNSLNLPLRTPLHPPLLNTFSNPQQSLSILLRTNLPLQVLHYLLAA